MSRWTLMLRKLFAPSRPVRKISLAVKPSLESVEERILPSASSAAMLPLVAVASPPAAPAVAAITSYVESTLNQWASLMATVQQDLSSVYTALARGLSLEAAYVRQEWGQYLGINPSTQNQAISNATPAKGSGSGSGSSSTYTHTVVSRSGETKVHTSKSGTGSGIGALTGSGNNATVSGQVWLDNNGNGSLDDDELGYSGATVHLINESVGGYQSTTTDSNGNYNFTFAPSATYNYEIQVIFPTGFWATYQGTSQINAQGYSFEFSLSPGGSETIVAGIQSTMVTTLHDNPDPNEQIYQNLVTLRDAMETANNGEGLHQGSTLAPVTFVDPSNGGPLTGAIGLQAALPAIAASYNIDGPGASILTVNGGGNASSIFAINAGVTTTISGLTITGGSGAVGGGIDNNGNLALNGDIIQGNTTSGQGGAVYNGKFAVTLSGDQLLGNTAASGGGLYNGGGTVTLVGGKINNNKAQTGVGGGIYNASGTVKVSGGTVINTNATGASGGGVANSGSFTMTGGQISNNFMLSGPGAGGGLYNVRSMKLLGVQIQGNSAVNGAGIYTTGQLVMAQNTSISGNNKASTDGAGIYVQGGTAAMVGGGITNNTAQGSGGGIYVQSGELWLQHGVNVSNNTAVGSNGGGYGGGVYLNSGTVSVSGGTLSKNIAGKASGGGIYNWGGTLTLKANADIIDNTAKNQGGGIYLAFLQGQLSKTTFNGCIVSSNVAQSGQGNGVYWQNGATVTQPIDLTDDDDPGGVPFRGN